MRKKVNIVARHVVLTLLAVFWLIPILWLICNSFSAYQGVNISHFFPEQWSLANYKAMLFEPD